MSYGMICESLGRSPRRLERWKQDEASPEIKERTQKPYNAMTEEEKIAVKEIVANEKHADESTRELSVRLMEERGLYRIPCFDLGLRTLDRGERPPGIPAQSNETS